MSDFNLATPVAFIIFNRPDTTERVFTEIARARPPKLLVVGDGARTNREGEAEKVAAARAIIDRVNWPCEVLTNYSETNLGCKIRVSSGLDWVFEQVEEAIILEDDCLPSQSFFQYCEELLNLYRNDLRISQISGTNLLQNKFPLKESYYFSSYHYIWGWATWKNRWKNNYDVKMKNWEINQQRIKDTSIESQAQKHFSKVFQSVYDNKIDTWDYQWFYSCLLNNQYSITPKLNLIKNIGFGIDATHTIEYDGKAIVDQTELKFPLVHVRNILHNKQIDTAYFEIFCKIYYFCRVKNKLSSIYRKLSPRK